LSGASRVVGFHEGEMLNKLLSWISLFFMLSNSNKKSLMVPGSLLAGLLSAVLGAAGSEAVVCSVVLGVEAPIDFSKLIKPL